jgi:hypothetical protein
LGDLLCYIAVSNHLENIKATAQCLSPRLFLARTSTTNSPLRPRHLLRSSHNSTTATARGTASFDAAAAKPSDVLDVTADNAVRALRNVTQSLLGVKFSRESSISRGVPRRMPSGFHKRLDAITESAFSEFIAVTRQTVKDVATIRATAHAFFAPGNHGCTQEFI